MPKSIKKKTVANMRFNDAYVLICNIVKELSGEVNEDHAKSVDQCHKENYSKKGCKTESIYRNHYWTGAADILIILATRLGIVDKKDYKITCKRVKEFK